LYIILYYCIYNIILLYITFSWFSCWSSTISLVYVYSAHTITQLFHHRQRNKLFANYYYSSTSECSSSSNSRRYVRHYW